MFKRFFKSIYQFLTLIFNAFLWEPIRGGNGKTQLDELAKYAIVVSAVWMIIYEGITEGAQFSDIQFITVFGALVAAGGLKMHYKGIPDSDNKNDKEQIN